MQKRELVAIILVLVSTFGVVGGVMAYKRAGESGVIVLTAQAPESGNWSPRIIEVNKGEEVTLHIRNRDVVTHGFLLPSQDILKREIKAGEFTEISFTFDEKGEYPFYCSSWCSDYHMQMRGAIIVK